MNAFYLENVESIYLAYGLVFVIMGYTIAIQVRNFSSLSNIKLARKLWLLAGFGLTHGIADFLLFILVRGEGLSSVTFELMMTLQLFMFVISYLFLFYFGIGLTDTKSALLKRTPIILFFLWCGLFLYSKLLLDVEFSWLVAASETWSRYLLGFPGACVSGYGLLLHWGSLRNITNNKAHKSILAASVAFFSYAVFAGLIVPPFNVFPAIYINTSAFFSVFKVPVEILRAISSVAMAYFIMGGLELFRLENTKQIEEAQRVKLLCEERERIRRDLHDGIIQSIYVAGLSLENSSFLVKENTEEAQLQIHGIMKQLDQIIEDLRHYIVNLNPESFAEIDLQQGIKKLLTEYQAINNISVNIEVRGAQCINLNEEERGNFYHIINEILTNVIKHADASSIKVSVVFQEKCICVTIKDNGNGFDLSQTKPAVSKGQGIKNMYTRARLVSGKLTVTSEVGKGTEISLCIDRREKGDEQNSLSFGR